MPEIKFNENEITSFMIAICLDSNLDMVHLFYIFMIEKSVSYTLNQKFQTFDLCCYHGNVNALNFILEKFPELIPEINKNFLLSSFLDKQFCVLKILLKNWCNYHGDINCLNRIDNEPTFESLIDEATFYYNIIIDIQ